MKKLTQRDYDVLLDADSISPADEAKLLAETRAKLKAEGKEALIERVISSRTGRQKL